MLTALCLHPSLDKSAGLVQFDPDAPNRVQVSRLDVGGKGVNVARAAQALGADVRLLGFDFDGEPVARAMEAEKVPCQLVAVRGRLRTNLKIREQATGRTIEINEQGTPVDESALSALEALLFSALRPGDWASLSGSLPPGVDPGYYAALCEKLRAAGCFAAVDCDGDALRAAVSAKPALIKPNAGEFAALTGADPGDDEAAIAACRALIARGVGMVCLSRGGDGALLVNRDGAWRCPAANVPVRGAQGAGDSLLAGLLTAFQRGMTPGDALRFGCAAAAASVMRPGTLLCQRSDVSALLPSLTVTALT